MYDNYINIHCKAQRTHVQCFAGWLSREMGNNLYYTTGVVIVVCVHSQSIYRGQQTCRKIQYIKNRSNEREPSLQTNSTGNYAVRMRKMSYRHREMTIISYTIIHASTV